MRTHPMNSLSGSRQIAFPPSRHHWSRLLGTCAVVAAVIAIYAFVYLSVRTGHRASDGRMAIDTGSRSANLIFAPAISLEKSVRDQPHSDEVTVFESVLAESRSSRRPILIALGTTHCLPCRQLERFLKDQQAILSKYFVVMKANLDDPATPGVLVRDRYRTRSETEGYTNYFPWIAFVDGTGELLVNADDNSAGLIGIPQGGPQDRAWFLRMLRIANPAITDDEIDKLDAAAQAYHKMLWRDPAPQSGHLRF
jgi:hypothetical protein